MLAFTFKSNYNRLELVCDLFIKVREENLQLKQYGLLCLDFVDIFDEVL